MLLPEALRTESMADCWRVLLLLPALLVCCAHAQPRVTLTYPLLEEQPSQTRIANIKTDANLTIRYSAPVLDTLRFSFLTSASSGGHNLFSIGEIDGILRTKGRIDRDQICAHEPICQVKLDIAVMPRLHFQIIKVTIDIRDLNDNWPTFPERQIHFDVLESTLPNTAFVLPSAEDLDSQRYGVQRYELISSAIDKFELKVKKKRDGSTDIKLVLKQPLDREAQDEYLVKVIAMDGGSPAKSGTLIVNIKVLDVNDNSPVFESPTYEAAVFENEPPGTPVITVVAKDPDAGLYGTIEYYFSSRTVKDFGNVFGIKNKTGEIYTKVPLDYESMFKKDYILSVAAKDLGQDSLPTLATVTVHVKDVNDHKPEVTIRTLGGGSAAMVPELAKAGTFVAQVIVSDKDQGENGEVECSVAERHFQLESQNHDNSEYMLVTALGLDRESQDTYTLTIECRDHGTPPNVSLAHFNVTVTDENDNAPKFSETHYKFNVFENSRVGLIIGKVFATDDDIGKNKDVLYVIDGDDENFDVDTHTGEIKTKRPFDYESTDSFTFNVVAVDQGKERQRTTAEVTVQIMDSNDNDPVFSKSSYTFGVQENEPVGTEVGQVFASDADSYPFNEIEYMVVEDSNDSFVFAIETETGIIRTRRRLDWEKQIIYHLTVRAQNRGYPDKIGSATVSIFVSDRNDNLPMFIFPNKDNYTIQVPMHMKQGYVIGEVTAIDMDSDDKSVIRYFIDRGNDESIFAIDSGTGILTTQTYVSLSPGSVYKLQIGARDGGYNENTAHAKLEIVVNATMIGSLPQTGGAGGLSAQNIIILGTVLLIFVILLIALVIAIMSIRRKERRRQDGKYNCRIETLKAMNNKKKDKKHNKHDKHKKSNPDLSRSEMELSVTSGGTTLTNGKPKKEVSFCLDLQDSTSTGKDYSHNQSIRQSWPSVIDQTSLENPMACSSLLGNSNRLSQMELRSQPHLQDNRGTTQHQPDRPKIYCKELEVKQLMNMLRVDQDADSSCSGEVSNTDSGRGASEEGELGSRINCAAHSFEGHHEDPQVVPNSFYSNQSNGSHGYSGPSFHGNNLNDTGSASSMYGKPHTPRAGRTLRHRSDDNLHDSYDDLGGSYLPVQINRSQWLQKTPEGTVHPRVARYHEKLNNKDDTMMSEMCDMSQASTHPGTVDYSCTDISHALADKHGAKLTPVLERSINSDCGPDDVSSTSGSYVVNPQELVQEINDLFFKDMVV